MDRNVLDSQELNALRSDYLNRPDEPMLGNMIQTNGIRKIAQDPKSKIRLNHTFSIDLKATDNDKITDQKRAGFCWMFATMNILRHHWIKKYNVKGFEISVNYFFFWDKIERANKYFGSILDTADKPTNDRFVRSFLDSPDDDGGEWDMVVSLIEKYGIMPDSSFPRTAVTNNTGDFNNTLGKKLRRDGMKLRQLVANHASDDEIKTTRNKMLEEVYRMTAISVGIPPRKFDFEYRDEKGNYHLDKGLTPQDFYHKYFDVKLADYVPIGNYPQHKFDQLYVQPDGDNVVGGHQVHYLNLDMQTLKRAAIAQLKDGDPVWFGNDVVKQSNNQDGLFDEHLYHYDELFDMDLQMDKRSRFQSQQAQSTHAMTFTGVDLDHDEPIKWQVENSWGAKQGKDGYYVMSDDWMDAHVDEVVVNKKYLSEEQQKMLNQEPIVLLPWE